MVWVIRKKLLTVLLRSSKQIAETKSEFDKEKLQERLAKLAGGVAVIRVGAATETEMKEAKLRLEDALAATRAAVEEGIIAGGGSAYIHASKKVARTGCILWKVMKRQVQTLSSKLWKLRCSTFLQTLVWKALLLSIK